MIGKLSVVVLGMCTALSAGAQDMPADFSSRVPLSVSGNGPWYRLELPLAVQLNARQADLSDVRVFNAAGEPQAYALSRQASQRSENRQVSDVKWFPLYAADNTSDSAPSVRVQSSATGTLVQQGRLRGTQGQLRGMGAYVQHVDQKLFVHAKRCFGELHDARCQVVEFSLQVVWPVIEKFIDVTELALDRPY